VVKDRKWSRNEIDRFVLARLEKEGLKPRRRRTNHAHSSRGIRPHRAAANAQEVDAFLADKSPEAYETLVDRLLDSPRFGEHEARLLARRTRYADSHGYHIDSDRSIWKYANGSSTHSIGTCRSTSLRSNNWPATVAERRHGSKNRFRLRRCNMSTAKAAHRRGV